MKALSERQADACENAKGGRCRCRCGGALHGAARGHVRELPDSDPHKPRRRRRRQLELFKALGTLLLVAGGTPTGGAVAATGAPAAAAVGGRAGEGAGKNPRAGSGWLASAPTSSPTARGVR